MVFNTTTWYARECFCGFFIFEDVTFSRCPFESISRINPFHFTDVDQVLSLRNYFFENSTSLSPCKWQFTAPLNYGFKILIKNLDFDGKTKLTVENRTDVLIK